MSPDAHTHRAETPNALPPGTRLGEFEVLGLLGVGGFGIVYRAFDHTLEREVAVKEYMPASLAGRTETMRVSIRSQPDAETFALGLKSFVNEARLLARFDHPSLLKVLRFWEANGTAYMAMPVLLGRNLKQVRAEMPGAPDEAWLRGLLDPLLGAIERLHSAGVYHRDIAPDNIQIEPDGRPVLLDFGAARRVIGDKTQSLTAILKPAYAPIEQYAEVGAVKQGPWTDLYALGATLHYLLLGRPPAPATARAVHDEASLLTVGNLPGCSSGFLQTVDWMLAPRPADRPQSVAALRDALAGRRQPRMTRPAPSPWDPTMILAPAPNEEATVLLPDIVATDRSVLAAAGPPPARSRAVHAAPELSAPPPATVLGAVPKPAGRARAWPLAAGLAALAALAAGAMFWPRTPAAPSAVAPAASAPAPAAAAAQSHPESSVAPVVAPPVQPARAVAAEPKAAASSAMPAAAEGGGPPASAAAAAAPQASAPVVRETPKPAVKAAPAKPRAAAAAEPPPPAGSPETQCAGLNPIMLFVCLERACQRPEFRNHADCEPFRK